MYADSRRRSRNASWCGVLRVLAQASAGGARKGYIAERQIGRALEQAITAKGCAVAHNVTGVMDSGDIDHIVATRRNVWVIETKYRRLRPERFQRAIARIHACRRRVEKLLPSGTRVRACLVLAYERRAVRPEQDGVAVFNNETFREGLLHELRAERHAEGDAPAIDEGVAATVWRLSRGETAADEAQEKPCEVQWRAGEARGGPSRAYARWTSEDDERLLDLYESGWDEKDLAREFGRKRGAIRSRLRKLA